MAEQIPFSIMELILINLGSLAAKKIGSMYSVSEELRKLEEKLGTIKAVLLDAEEKQEKSTAVQHWLRRLKDVVYDADDLMDDFATHHLQLGGLARQVSHFLSLPNQVAFRFKMSHRIKDIRERLHDIAEDIRMLNLIPRDTVHGGAESSGRETHSFVLTSEIVGRDENKEEITRLLVSSDSQERLSVVAIVGIGGVGKTTLAQLVYNDKKVTEYFKLKIWIHVSDNFDVKMLVRKILESLSCGLVENLGFDVLKIDLHEKLKEKKYLLVLDDVWNHSLEKWDQLRILLMVGGEGSKILVTTRETKVASVVGVNSPIFLRGLEENQSWELFLQMASTRGQEQEKGRLHLMDIGKKIIRMSRGVPLAIKILGRLVLQLETEESQRLFVKNKNLMSLQDGNDNVLSVLKLSYDNLPIHLKQCFAYCSLFPKDYSIEKKSLVQLWIAQGYIQSSHGDEHLEDVGNQYFEELLSRSLFEKHADSNIIYYKMHDLIHDLARSVIGSDILILEHGVKDVLKRFHHVSLFRPSRIVAKNFKAKSIRTFLMFYIDASIVSTLIPCCKSLRALKLEIWNAKNMPKSLENLSHLRYLDLSYNNFEVLPNTITKLKNLRTLKVVGCRNLKELPEDIKELVNLRHLENDECMRLTHMPSGIGQLTSLHSLSVFVVGRASVDASIGSLGELNCLNQLRGELWIRGIENVKDGASEMKEANLKGKQYLQSLILEWSWSEIEANGVELVMEGLHPHPNLKKLCLIGYKARRLPSWMLNGAPGSLLHSLESLELLDMEEVEYMMDGCTSTMLFPPSLQTLKLDALCKLKELWRRDLPVEKVASFPCLSKLYVHKCPSLTSLPLSSSPYLSELCVRICDNLPSLLLPSSSHLCKLEISSCLTLTSLLLPSSFPCLSKLTIRDCHRLTSLTLPSSTPYLSELCISVCDNLTSLLLPSSPYLSSLHISGFPKLTSVLPTLPCASPLHVHHCPNLTSLALPSSPFLSQLRIENCRNLTLLEVPSSPCLSELYMNDCHKLTSLKVPSLPCLEKLHLHGAEKEILWQLMFVSSSLKSVSIENIDDMISFPEEVLQHLSTLQTLSIVGLATIPHRIGSLASLRDLQIVFCYELTSLPEEMGSLSTLQTLIIDNCSSLATLPNWIGNLTSLTQLQICSCPELTSLPEAMHSLRTLKKLNIENCPHIRERCNEETGEDWPKIAHVEEINIS